MISEYVECPSRMFYKMIFINLPYKSSNECIKFFTTQFCIAASEKQMSQSVDDDVTTVSKSVTNIAEECEKGEGFKSITIAETDVDEHTSCKDIQMPQTVTYRKSTKGAKYIPVKKTEENECKKCINDK